MSYAHRGRHLQSRMREGSVWKERPRSSQCARKKQFEYERSRLRVAGSEGQRDCRGLHELISRLRLWHYRACHRGVGTPFCCWG